MARSIKPEWKRFLMMAEGFGGTVRFERDLEKSLTGSTQHRKLPLLPIGTGGLVTCVGVFFNVDADRSFLAHLNAGPRQGCKPTQDWNKITSLTNTIKARLDHESKKQRWPAKGPIMTSSLILACPYPDRSARRQDQYAKNEIREQFDTDEAHLYTGRAMADGILQWLDLPASFPVHTAHGFVKEAPDSNPIFLDEDDAGLWIDRDTTKLTRISW